MSYKAYELNCCEKYLKNMSVAKLLREVRTITENSEFTAAKREYNIFRVLECEEKEVLMCRMLADLLNPNGQHGKGKKFLEGFLEDVLHEPDAKKLSSTVEVYKEYPIDAERRIDLVIAGKGRFFPIEVKINAVEQAAQCYDYYQYAVKRDPNARIVYLTLYGSKPSEYSRMSKDGKNILDLCHVQTISFKDDIVSWLQNMEQFEQDPMMFFMLHQYRQAICFIVGSLKEKQDMTLIDSLLESEENFRSMLAISAVEKRAKAKLIYNVLAEFEKEMENILPQYNLVREKRFHWYEYPEKATELYYRQEKSTYPGINYVISDVRIPNGIELWLRIEVEDNLFFGLCLFDPSAKSEFGTGNQLDEPSEYIKESLSAWINTSDAQYDNWWVQWWYLPTGEMENGAGKEKVPNFKSMNDAAVQLSDSSKRTAFVKESVHIIDEKLRQILY